jgi:hypothetical protein
VAVEKVEGGTVVMPNGLAGVCPNACGEPQIAADAAVWQMMNSIRRMTGPTPRREFVRVAQNGAI